MDLLVPASSQAQTRKIPLVCGICPHQPTFCDLSHLLTHISSKAHLSTYYKLKVRSGSDNAARQSVEGYDIWYAENDIESFMSERMKHKEERKKIKTEALSNVKTIKQEVHSPTVTPSSASYDDTASVYPHPYAAFAPMYSWAAHPYLYPRQDSAFVEAYDQEAPSDVSLIPRKRKIKAEAPHTGEDDEHDDDDTSKLKGIVWPGMGLFDAATPELKKKRNQKKDISVSDRLATMSEGIQKEELIFSPSGSLCKKRVISGQPQAEDDLLPGEELPVRAAKAKKAPRKKPLEGKKPRDDKNSSKDKDPNALMKPTLRLKGKKKAGKQPTATTDGDEQEESRPDEEVPRKTRVNKRKKAPLDKAEEEEEGDTQMDMNEATLEQPAVITQLTSGYQQAPMYVAAAPMGFRAAEPTYMNMTGQSYYQFPAGQNHSFSYDPSPLTTWDYFGYGMGSSLTNPLFSGMFGGSFGDDDDDDEDNEGTISAPISES
ncbi:hypothetical protein KCU81_g7834, partial [Aureobasidium melanogenum]|uniref:Uncharacterized protein n=1 Tax=Aureobasidium melanogenum (strain CBS 110374) TaxID=1043003 RepID=A0A074VHB8_AURM1